MAALTAANTQFLLFTEWPLWVSSSLSASYQANGWFRMHSGRSKTAHFAHSEHIRPKMNQVGQEIFLALLVPSLST